MTRWVAFQELAFAAFQLARVVLLVSTGLVTVELTQVGPGHPLEVCTLFRLAVFATLLFFIPVKVFCYSLTWAPEWTRFGERCRQQFIPGLFVAASVFGPTIVVGTCREPLDTKVLVAAIFSVALCALKYFSHASQNLIETGQSVVHAVRSGQCAKATPGLPKHKWRQVVRHFRHQLVRQKIFSFVFIATFTLLGLHTCLPGGNAHSIDVATVTDTINVALTNSTTFSSEGRPVKDAVPEVPFNASFFNVTLMDSTPFGSEGHRVNDAVPEATFNASFVLSPESPLLQGQVGNQNMANAFAVMFSSIRECSREKETVHLATLIKCKPFDSTIG